MACLVVSTYAVPPPPAQARLVELPGPAPKPGPQFYSTVGSAIERGGIFELAASGAGLLARGSWRRAANGSWANDSSNRACWGPSPAQPPCRACAALCLASAVGITSGINRCSKPLDRPAGNFPATHPSRIPPPKCHGTRRPACVTLRPSDKDEQSNDEHRDKCFNAGRSVPDTQHQPLSHTP